MRSEKGHGGGWTLARPLEQVTLRDVHAALGMTALFAFGNRTESPGCAVEQIVNETMGKAMGEAEALLMKRLGELTLADLARGVRSTAKQRMKVR